MNDHSLTNAGRRLMNRRSFLRACGHGPRGHRARQPAFRSAAAGRRRRSPIRPVIRPENPLAARPPHFAPKAKRVLVIFCSGACSQLESWDWKPELARMDGKPMPGAAENFLTFQGQNGNLVRPLYEFKPRGQSGKMISDLFPHLAELADDLCFIHSMTAKSNTHGPAENQMSTGFTLDGFPEHRLLGQLRARLGGRRSSGVRGHSRSARRAAGGRQPWVEWLPARRLPGRAFNVQKPIYNLARPPASRFRRRRARCPQNPERTASRKVPRRFRIHPPASPATNWPRRCSSPSPRWPTFPGNPRPR
jgi:hypothetical protein